METRKLKAYKYLKSFPKPLIEDFINGSVIPFIGSGFSKNAEYPSNKEMPDWNQLGKIISQDLPSDFVFNNPVDAISTYEQEYSRTKLVEKLTELLLIGIIKPGKAHLAFSKIPFNFVCTTNFDFLIERSYELTNRFCRPIIDEEHLAINSPDNKTISLLKIHGDLHHPKRLIATEEDYDSFLTNYPLLATYIANILISKTSFFIGYSLDDPDFRLIWQLIKNRLGKMRRQAYVLTVGASKQNILKYERRGVKVINFPSSSSKSYSTVLEEIFSEISDFWIKELPYHSIAIEEGAKIQLAIDTDKNSRLCMFSVPVNYLAFYRKYIFPIVQSYNFIPVTVDELIESGNYYATFLALIERATLIVVDMSTENTIQELDMIIGKKKSLDNIIIISEDIYDFPLSLKGKIILHKPSDFIEDSEEFINRFEIHFSEYANAVQNSITNEPQRLFEKQEYAASVISSVTLLEDVLRNHLIPTLDKPSNFYSLTKLLEIANSKNLISFEQKSELRDWLVLRNRLVHTSQRRISKSLSAKIIDSIDRIIRDLRNQNL